MKLTEEQIQEAAENLYTPDCIRTSRLAARYKGEQEYELPAKVEAFANKKEKEGIFYKTIGDNIAKARKALKITQEHLAECLGISRVSLVNIESGKQRLPLHHISSICEILKTSIAEIVPSRKEQPADINAGQSVIIDTGKITMPDGKVYNACKCSDAARRMTQQGWCPTCNPQEMTLTADGSGYSFTTNPAKEEPSSVEQSQIRNPLLEHLRKEISEEDKQYVNAHIQALDLLEDYKEQFRAEIMTWLENKMEQCREMDMGREEWAFIQAYKFIKSIK